MRSKGRRQISILSCAANLLPFKFLWNHPSPLSGPLLFIVAEVNGTAPKNKLEINHAHTEGITIYRLRETRAPSSDISTIVDIIKCHSLPTYVLHILAPSLASKALVVQKTIPTLIVTSWTNDRELDTVSLQSSGRNRSSYDQENLLMSLARI
ncbi:hypothetical protein L873DRAFT_720612 [Choiromyces venosus 120613-1]|uniref:Uncharacterized protein n=1 Tax=Choiromyces venosus 120613-1 TaxID=1336337 RepID=A0A3N4K4Z0_9PEZI|nr:hypothetical protein L873DRAFT_720612 [Choiromyces venosus 120613-1]